jgi:hypothetical protein
VNQLVLVDQREQVVQLGNISRKHLQQTRNNKQTSNNDTNKRTQHKTYLLLLRRAEEPAQTVEELSELPVACVAWQLLSPRKRPVVLSSVWFDDVSPERHTHTTRERERERECARGDAGSYRAGRKRLSRLIHNASTVYVVGTRVDESFGKLQSPGDDDKCHLTLVARQRVDVEGAHARRGDR